MIHDYWACAILVSSPSKFLVLCVYNELRLSKFTVSLI